MRLVDQKRSKRSRRTFAFSLLEVILAMVVAALILVPTASMMSQALKGERTRVKRAELLLLARGKQEECCHLARVSFQNRSEAGTFANRGNADIAYSLSCSDNAGQGGIPGRLQSIRVVAWYDEDSDQVLDASEAKAELWTCIARATP